ncbi:MAG: cytochrome P450 [Pseudomonadales bacterium]
MAQAELTIFDFEVLKNPYPTYQQLRDQAPVHFEPSMNIHVVTRYDLVREAIRDTETYSSRFDQFLQEGSRMMFEAAAPEIQAEIVRINEAMIEVPPTMLTLDEPEHTKYRSLVNQLFTASQTRKAQDTVERVIAAAIADMESQAGAANAGDVVQGDFITAFADPVPLRIIGDRLGIPEQDRAFFNKAATAAASALRLTPLTGEQMVERAQTALDLQNLLVRLVDARRADPADDMITILANSRLQDEDRLLTHGECIGILNQFLVAGHETTSSSLGWGMLMLCQQPELQAQLRGDEKLVKVFCEEVLRLEAPVQGLPRLVTRDTELGGYPLKAGELIMLRYGAANRDERQFENPDALDVTRKKAGSQLAFGAGVHFCIGAPLARQELNLSFLALLDAGQDFALTEPPPDTEISFILRNMPSLKVRYQKT